MIKGLIKGLHICSFDAVSITPRMTYAAFKKEALKAGRFSVFEATENKRVADLFTRLCNDPEVEIERSAYPWTAVRERKVKP